LEHLPEIMPITKKKKKDEVMDGWMDGWMDGRKELL
jgi:hypothetical protein